MAASLVHSNKIMKRTESKKSHSWWWDSHISRKNSKWLAENLEEMDQSVKRMLKLIEEDGDSFAKKAEMYYKKRPELISHVEDFYRMYRSLAERYDHVTGELRKNIPSDLQSQGSGISDIGSELPSTWPSPDQKPTRRKSGPRAAGFEFFLGSGGSNSDTYQKEGDESCSLSDSDLESDVSSVNNYSGSLGNGGDQMINGKIIELEIELREVKERLWMQQEENVDGSLRASRSEHSEDLFARIAGYEQELRNANEKIRLSEEEIARLKIELYKYKSSKFTNDLEAEFESATEKDVNSQEAEPEASELHERTGGLESETSNPDSKIRALVEELRITKERLQDSEKEMANLKNEVESNRSSEKISHLQDQLESAQKEIAMWKAKLNLEKKEVSKLHERISRLKNSLSDRDHEIRDLKIAVSDAEQKIFPEKAQIKAEISGLLEERMRFEEQLREWESRGRALEEEIRKVKAEKTKMEERLNSEIEQLRADIAERTECIESLSGSVDALKSDKDQLNARMLTLQAELSSRDDRIDEMDKHLQQLHVEHADLIAGAEGAHKLVEELRSRTNELEEEIERQRVLILEGGEEKREVIRQLCFSLEHYRNGYHMLRQAFISHKRVPVFAS